MRPFRSPLPHYLRQHSFLRGPRTHLTTREGSSRISKSSQTTRPLYRIRSVPIFNLEIPFFTLSNTPTFRTLPQQFFKIKTEISSSNELQEGTDHFRSFGYGVVF